MSNSSVKQVTAVTIYYNGDSLTPEKSFSTLVSKIWSHTHVTFKGCAENILEQRDGQQRSAAQI